MANGVDVSTEDAFSSQRPGNADSSEEGFNEVAYLIAYPDVAAAVRAGEWESALEHYRTYGAKEDRLSNDRYILATLAGDTVSFPPASVDRMVITESGEFIVSGWIADNQKARLRQVALRDAGALLGTATGIARQRRQDVEEREGLEPGLFGFWTLGKLQTPIERGHEADVLLSAGADRRSYKASASMASNDRLRTLALLTLSEAKYLGDPETETLLQLDGGTGQSLIALNLRVVDQIAGGALKLRFGVRPSRFAGSVVVVLFGKAEYLTLQAAMFSQCADFDQYEYIYVSNSPELNDTLVRDATNASRIYEIAITLILLPGNIGFGSASNLGAQHAESDRILFINPDVFPRELSWPRSHKAIVDTLPAEQTALFGVPLYSSDGALMHSGIYVNVRGGCSLVNGSVIRRDVLQVEHYAKGAPSGAKEYLAARPVPAVTGAFISADRAWFERLGGFSPEYIFGHYEDVDLCFKSLQAGTPAWVHPIPFWHLESAGSKTTAIHSAAKIVNSWLLTKRWGDLVLRELNGRHPKRFDMGTTN